MLADPMWSMTRTASEVLTHLCLHRWHVLGAVACAAIWTLLRWLLGPREQVRTTQLRGPPSESFLYGVGKRILDAEDSGAMYEAWAQKYDPVYAVPSTLGKKRIVLCDPKAIAHFYARETWTYGKTPFITQATAHFLGKGLSWSHGEDHKRQRSSLAPAFNIAAIRQLTPIFYDSAYKAKGAWDILIESSGGDCTMIDIHMWTNHISLDIIGLAGFSHNFGTLQGKRAHVADVFEELGTFPHFSAIEKVFFLLVLVFPSLFWVPTSRTRLLGKLKAGLEEISSVLLARTEQELDMGVVEGKEKSVIGLLIKGASGQSAFHLTKDEVAAQIRQLLVAGYGTVSASLTWALLELSRHPDVQTKLRNELLEYGADPTYDHLANSLPYLDAVVHEILRVHPPVPEFTRVAFENDLIPLSEPVRTKSGELVDSLTIAKGTFVAISILSMNRSTVFWGEDAKVFRPSRWLGDAHGQNGIPAKAKEIQGHRHLLTFVDGQRMCLGKNFAVTELKAVLTVLVKNFVFELRGGIDSKIKIEQSMGHERPKLAGEVGWKLPLLVRPYVA